MSQRDIVLKRLIEAGDRGVNSFWGYRSFIPRMGAIVFNLRQEGYDILSVRKANHSCQYILSLPSVRGKLMFGSYYMNHAVQAPKVVDKRPFWQKLFKIFKK